MLEVSLKARIGRLSLEVQLAAGDGPFVLVGPNGAGKTSLLLMVLGVVSPRRGRILLNGRPLFDADRGIDLPPEERGLGYLPQSYGLFPHMSALENVEFALACRDPGQAPRARRDEALGRLEDLGVAELARRRPASLSGGERQRVALARALAARPEALLLDEPLAALDAGARRRVRTFVAEYLRELGMPALVVTHDPADAAAIGGRVAVLEGGRLIQQGSFDELRERPGSPFVAEFVASGCP
ncbi:molybdenum ABC transporter ATPase [Sorangium cellulosum]|uniref:Molybdenum ABC transporter ATPase n=1 Tax=Sorangium cellulosum TaxID=56 RepID=A0A4P2PZK3_SORCE|nr:ATP-binding cassette domain-containing protein [Sorangium cellulosum]AUX22354.1 molybdenum ABC transporter ATPase [Sorangium cellulosum]